MQNQIQLQPLQENHDTEAFTCGVDALDRWLKVSVRESRIDAELRDEDC